MNCIILQLIQDPSDGFVLYRVMLIILFLILVYPPSPEISAVHKLIPTAVQSIPFEILVEILHPRFQFCISNGHFVDDIRAYL